MAVRAASWAGQDPTADSEGGPAEWPALYSQYLLRSANQSARSLELYQEVMDCISRNELAPTALQDMLAAFIQARGTAYTNKLAEISMQFFSRMVQIGTAYSDELAELAMPGSAEPPLMPPQFDTADPMRWFQQLNDYASQLSARAMRAYQSLFEHAAAGDMSPNRLQEVSNDYLQQRLPEHLRRLGGLYFDVLSGLTDLRAGYEEEFLTGVLATAKRQNQGEPFILNLTAPLGETASATVSLSNTKDEPAIIRSRASDVRRADGVDPAFAPKITIIPETLKLQPGEEASLVLSLQLDEGDYEPDVLYVGTLQITGHGEPSVEVPLRIKATPARERTAVNGSE